MHTANSVTKQTWHRILLAGALAVTVWSVPVQTAGAIEYCTACTRASGFGRTREQATRAAHANWLRRINTLCGSRQHAHRWDCARNRSLRCVRGPRRTWRCLFQGCTVPLC